MTPEPTITVELDQVADAAYIRLTQGNVAKTVEFRAYMNIDLDALDMVVGVELLTLAVPVPISWADAVEAEFHVPSNVKGGLKLAIDALSQITRPRPSASAHAPHREPFTLAADAPRSLEPC